MADEFYDVGIIGGGVAGLAAGMYAGRLKLKTKILTEVRGGTLILTNEIMNWPGIIKIDGMSLANQLEQHVMDYKDNVEIIDSKVESISKISSEPSSGFEVKTKSKSYFFRTLIFATGTKVRKLGVPGEEEFSGKGVHYCALCDGFNYMGKTVCVVGGSDSAAKEALILTQWAKKVYIIYRRDKLRAEPANLERVEKNDKIEIITNTNVLEILGDDRVHSVKLDREFNNSNILKTDAVFIEIGRIPETKLAKEIGVELNEKGEIITNKESETNLPGVYAAGDCTNSKFKQAIIAAAEGVAAAYSAYTYLSR